MTSRELFERASRVIPGGVNSPVRAFGSVGDEPVYMVKGKGARMTDVEGNEYVDFCGSWGPLILGHARDEVTASIVKAAQMGTSFGTNTPCEVEFAELICSMIPCFDQVRLVNSGTEAVMTALRIARGVTGRPCILKFEGCYHGHTDYMLVSAGSGLLTGGISSSAGVSPASASEVFVAPFNDINSVESIVKAKGDQLAAIIVEPVAGNMGLVPPVPGFLAGLRKFADSCGALLVFDEVISGFRLGPTTYSVIADVTPDLITLGKIIGGGMPIGAVGGKREVMERLAPIGPVYQAGTLSGNPVTVAAGLKTLNILKNEDPYSRLNILGTKISQSINSYAREKGLPVFCSQLGGMFTLFFKEGEVTNLKEAKICDIKKHAVFFRKMLDKGFYLPPSQFEVCFISATHTEADIDAFIETATDAVTSIFDNT